MSKISFRYNNKTYTPTAERSDIKQVGFQSTAIVLVISVVFLSIVCISLNLSINRSSADNTELSGLYNLNSVYEPVNTLPSFGSLPEGTDTSEVEIQVFQPAKAITLYRDGNTAALGETINAGYAIAINANSGKILAGKNSREKVYPASLTKVMTAIVAYEYMLMNNVDMMSTYLTVTKDITDYIYREDATNAGFKLGEEVRIYDVFHGLILPSGADSSLMLSKFCYGGDEEFVNMMNNKVAEMGLTATHFTNTTGIHNKNHYSTCEELAIILQYACEYDFLRYLMALDKYTYAETNKNYERSTSSSLYRWRTTYASKYGINFSKTGFGETVQLGGKNGFTNEAKCCLFTFAYDANGNEYIVVTCSANQGYQLVRDYITIYNKYCKFN